MKYLSIYIVLLILCSCNFFLSKDKSDAPEINDLGNDVPEYLLDINSSIQCETSSDCRAEYDLECNMISLNKDSTDIKNLFGTYRVKRCPVFKNWPRSICLNGTCEKRDRINEKYKQNNCTETQFANNTIFFRTYLKTEDELGSNIQDHTYSNIDSTARFLLNEWNVAPELYETLDNGKELKTYNGSIVYFPQKLHGFNAGTLGFKIDSVGTVTNAYCHLYDPGKYSFLSEVSDNTLIQDSTIHNSFVEEIGGKKEDYEFLSGDTVLPTWNTCYSNTLLYSTHVYKNNSYESWSLVADAINGTIYSYK